uniref:Uncharacterized protein n=1 Tax=Rheinheimera sp. BAL341 TaxID=1708203 RepID=A0A486XL86_9GAMM
MRLLNFIVVLVLVWSNIVLAEKHCPIGFKGKNGVNLEPGEVINSVGVLNSDPSQLFSWVKTQNDEGYLLPVEGNADGLQFNVLWHPTLPWVGGQADIILTDGISACPSITVNIAAMERADGAFDALIALLRQGLGNEVVPLGKDFDSLLEQEQPDVPALQMLSAFSHLLGSEDDPESLSYWLAQMRAHPEQRESLSLLEGLLHSTGLLETMYEDLNIRAEALLMPDGDETIPPQSHLLRLPTSPDSEDEFAMVTLFYQPQDAAQFLSVISQTTRASATVNLSVFKDAKSLSEAMYDQFHSQTGLLPNVQIYRDAAGSLLTAGNALATASGAKLLGRVYEGAGAGLFMWTIFDKLRDGLYPHKLLDMKIAASHDLIYVQTSPDRGAVNAIWVTPHAKGLDMSKIALDFVVQFLPVNKLASMRSGSAINRIAANDSLGRPLNAVAEKQFQGALQKAKLNDGMLEGLLDTSKWTVLGKIIEKLPGNGVIAPFNYPPVNIFERNYVDLKLAKPGIVDVDFPKDGMMIYRALAVGSVHLNAYTRSGKFGNANATAEFEVRVRESQGLYISPSNPIVMPGEKIRLYVAWGGEEKELPAQFIVNVDVSPSTHRYQLSPAARRMLINGYENWAYSLDIDTSKDLQSFPIHVKASLQSRPEINASARIDPTAIMPSEGCIEPGTSTTFRVPISGGKLMQGLHWQVTQGPGQINQRGEYVAPPNASKREQVSIQARSPKGMVLTRDMRLSCGCEWRLNAYGQKWEGVNVYMTSIDEPGRRTSHMLQAGDVDTTIVISSGQRPQLGTLLGVMTASLGTKYLTTSGCSDEDQNNLCDPKEPLEGAPIAPSPPTYTINNIEGDYVEGTIAGQAIEGHLLTGQQSVLPTIPFSFYFRAKRAKFNVQHLGLARSLIKTAGDTSENTLTRFTQLTDVFGVGSCESDPEWEEAKRGRRRDISSDDEIIEDIEFDEEALTPPDPDGPIEGEEEDNDYGGSERDDPDPFSSAIISGGVVDDSIPLLPDVSCLTPGQRMTFDLPATHAALRSMLNVKINGHLNLGADWQFQVPVSLDSPFLSVGLHEKQTDMRLAHYLYPIGCEQPSQME